MTDQLNEAGIEAAAIAIHDARNFNYATQARAAITAYLDATGGMTLDQTDGHSAPTDDADATGVFPKYIEADTEGTCVICKGLTKYRHKNDYVCQTFYCLERYPHYVPTPEMREPSEEAIEAARAGYQKAWKRWNNSEDDAGPREWMKAALCEAYAIDFPAAPKAPKGT